MSKSTMISLLMLSSVILNAQDLRMTFTASGAASKVDSVKATNLRTGENVSLPGNDTLVLALNTGIITLSDPGRNGMVFPNPCPGKTTLVANIAETQTAVLKVLNLSGQVLAQASAAVGPGKNIFTISLSKTGIYLISLATSQGTSAFKVICTETGGNVDWIRYQGISSGNDPGSYLKDMTVYRLRYSSGDIILYRCRGGVHTTIITDSPASSKTYAVEFDPCIDPDGKSYAIVKIGTQTWMAENLAWLPKVCTPDTGAEDLKFYYVYGFNDTAVSIAKNTQNYRSYGVLYNWPAAMNSAKKKNGIKANARAVCPEGWHMPGDDEWKILEMNLGMSQADADTLFLRTSGEAGMKMKTTLAWPEDSLTSNSSGFSSLPAGYRNTHGVFESKLRYSLFWTSTQSDTMSWYRCLDFNDRGVYRMTTLRSHGFSVRCIRDTL